MNSFEVPSIPKIFVPQNLLNKSSESQNSSKISKSSSKPSNIENQNKESNSLPKEKVSESTTENPNPPPLPPPQLCASCSQILLSYFVPLQQYVNEVVQMARGDRQVSVPPVLPILKVSDSNVSTNQILVQSSDQSNQRNSESFERNSDNYSNRDTERSDNRSHDNHRVNQNYSGNQSTVNYQNQSRDQNQNYNRNTNYSQNQNYNQNQSTDQNSQNRNYGNESYNRSDNYQSEEQNRTEGAERVTEYPQNHPSKQTDRHYEDNQTQHSFDNQTNDKPITDDNTGYSNGQTQEESDNKFVSSPESSDDSRQESANNENEQNISEQTRGETSEYRKEQTPSYSSVAEVEWRGTDSPYAFVTIAYNNLSATNAIILANSLLLTNNKSMNLTDNNGNKSLIQIPFVILIGGSIDPVLKEAIYMVFDEVISQPMDVRVALLSDESFGVQQYKLQLWKELKAYDKCLYLESSTLVVGRVTNLFEECQELSACVDWLFPDNFNCSVFVFEPSLTTYEQILSFAIFHQKCSAQKDEGVGDTLDEMTLLNQFFAPKWNKLSFIYNFVKNDAIYTQIPAFMKYGDSIKIVNFGHMMSQSGGLGNQSGMSSVHPWHILFDLLASSQQDVIKAMSIDNYSKFYLNCFIQRLWPIIQNPLIPLLVTKYGIGRREWSIFDLIRLLTNESGIETNDHMFTQRPITFRRIKSSAEKMAQYDNLSIHEDEVISEKMPVLSLDESDSEPKDSDGKEDNSKSEQTIEETDKLEDDGKREEPKEELTPQQEDDRSKREWEAGRIDWMGAHQSDKIIDRLKKMIRNE